MAFIAFKVPFLSSGPKLKRPLSGLGLIAATAVAYFDGFNRILEIRQAAEKAMGAKLRRRHGR